MSAGPSLPDTVADAGQLDSLLCEPSPAAIEALGRVEGDVIVLGVGGKMGPTLARMARRALSRCRASASDCCTDRR